MAKLYAFQARNASGKKIRGQMEANSEMAVIRNLRESHFIPTLIEEKTEERPLFQRRVPLKELAMTCRQLSVMVRTGVPIIQALTTIQNQMKNKRLAQILQSVINDLKNGHSVADSFYKRRSYFPPLFINLLYAAEENGKLDQVLLTLAESFDKEMKLRKKIRSAFSYPIFILLFAVIMIGALIIFVLPTFLAMFKQTGAELPWITDFLLRFNHFFFQWGILLIVGIFLLFFLLHYWTKTKEGKRAIDTFLCRFPIIGDIVTKYMTFRFSQTLHDLYSSGVVMEKSLKIVSEVITNAYYNERIQFVRNQILKGNGFANALQKSGIFPSVLVSMVLIGEESGELETMLKDVSEFSQGELEQKLNDITTYIEPILLIVVGLLIGTSIIGILLPLYDGIINIG